MNQEEQGKKTSQVISDAAVKEDLVIPAKPTDLSDEDLDKVAGGAKEVALGGYIGETEKNITKG